MDYKQRRENGLEEVHRKLCEEVLLDETAEIIGFADRKAVAVADHARKAAVPHGNTAQGNELPNWTLDRPAVLARANQIVTLLSERIIRDGWTFDAKRAARFLVHIQEWDPENGDCEHFTQILKWVSDHGQSLDWLLNGDMEGSICRLASFATPAPKAQPKLVIVSSDDPPAPGAA